VSRVKPGSSWLAAVAIAASCGGSAVSEVGAAGGPTGDTGSAGATGAGGSGGAAGTALNVACAEYIGISIDPSECIVASAVAAPVRDCRLLLGPEFAGLTPWYVNVAVGCDLVPYSDVPPDEDSEIQGWWRYDDLEAPTTVIIEGELCEVIREQGVERIDAIWCQPHDLP